MTEVLNYEQIATQALYEARRESGFDYKSGDSIQDRAYELKDQRERVVERMRVNRHTPVEYAWHQAIQGYTTYAAEALIIARESGRGLSFQQELAILALGYKEKARTAKFVYQRNTRSNIHKPREKENIQFLEEQAAMLRSGARSEFLRLNLCIFPHIILERLREKMAGY